MNLDYKKILQYLFPSSDDEKIIENVLPEVLINSMQIRSTDEVNTLLQYSDKRVRSAIHLLKFHNHTHARKLLSAVLTAYLVQTLKREYIIIPVPLSKKRWRQRGYNQVTEIINGALPSLPLARKNEQILIRTHNTIPQTSLSREERLNNVREAFSTKNPQVAEQRLSGKHVVLVDDVMTTGATLKAARNALEPLCPASITCVALAH
jgi:ComF family protein